MAGRLDDSCYDRLDARLAPVDAALEAAYPGDTGSRQPVHTVYVAAHEFTADLPARWGAQAAELMDRHLAGATDLAELLGVSPGLSEQVRPLVATKLATEPIEDLRIDFEDGYGTRPDPDEDAAALRAGTELSRAVTTGSAPPFVGIRLKCLEPSTRRRGLRTVDLFLTALLDQTPLPDGFVLTLPKVTHVAQVEAFAQACADLEQAHGLDVGRLRFEVQVETPQAVQSSDGRAAVALMVQAGLGRITGLHYGTYDYSAACAVTAANQSLAHPVADHAKAVMQLAVAGTGVRLSDGSTNVVPAGTAEQIRAAWRLHAGLVRRSLDRAYYQGWDLHPGQLVTRFAAVYTFYREAFPDAAARLAGYLGSGPAVGVLDEPATAQALAALLVRGLDAGALGADEVTGATGTSVAVLDRLHRRRVG